MSIRDRKNLRRPFSVERAEQAMKMRGLSRLDAARTMGMINGGSYREWNDDKGCYKGLCKAFTDGLISDQMLDRFCKVVDVDQYVISGEADSDLHELYDLELFADDVSFDDYKKSLDLNRYPYMGSFPRLLQAYEPEIFRGDGLIGAYNQLMSYFGVRWIDTKKADDEDNSEIHGRGYYDLMDNILSSIKNCISEFDDQQQTTLVYKPEHVDNLINNFRVELYENGLLDADVYDE